MKNAGRISLLLLALALILALSPSYAAISAQDPQGQEQPKKEANASGKVTSVTESKLTLEIDDQGRAKSIEFILNEATKMEGKVEKDSKVEVTYRAESGRNIATLVRVVAS